MQALIENYKTGVEDGAFVAGTSAKAIVFHECGHIYTWVHKVDCKHVCEVATGTSGDKMYTVVNKYLSGYAADALLIRKEKGGPKYGEIIAESFSASLSGCDNALANVIIHLITEELPC